MSIKGGVGKSTISILLSIELNRLGKRLILVDMDLSGYTSFLAGIREPGIFFVHRRWNVE
ncbi:P-loop NTPase [Metallosphaera sedula]